MKQKLIVLTVFSICAFSFSSICSGQPVMLGGSPEELLFMNIPTVNLASKTEESIIDTPGTAYVITQDDLKRYGIRDLKQALKFIPNMELKWDYNWLQGGQRGYSAGFAGTILMIDGRSVQGLLGDEAFTSNNFPVDRIERIEVLQGPNSTLYGPNATEGIINMVTKLADSSEKNKNISQIESYFGGVNTQQVGAIFKRTQGDLTYGLSAAFFSSEQDWKDLKDFWANKNDYSRDPSIDVVRDMTFDDNKTKNKVIDAFLKYNDFYAGVNFNQHRLRNAMEVPSQRPSMTSWDKRTDTLSFLGWKKEVLKNLTANLEYAYFTEDVYGTSLYYTSSTGLWTTKRELFEGMNEHKLKGQLDYLLDRHALGFGFAFTNYDWGSHKIRYEDSRPLPDAAWSDTWYGMKNDDILFQNERYFYLKDKIDVIKDFLIFHIGCLYDYRKGQREKWLPRASLILKPDKDSAVKFTLAKGFKPRSIWERYFPDFATSNTYDMTMYELNYSTQKKVGDVKFTNIAAIYKMDRESFIGQPDYSRGFEDQLRINYKKLSGIFSLDIVRPSKRNYAGEDNILNVPQSKIKLGISYDFLAWLNASIFIDHWAKVKTNALATDGVTPEVYTVPSWTTVDFVVNVGEIKYKNCSVTFTLDAENLFNTTYYHAQTRSTQPLQYMQPLRTIYFKTLVEF